MQQSETQRQSNKLLDLRKRLEDLTSKHTLSNSVRIAAISRKQTSLHHRIISIARRIHLLIPALRGQCVTLKEEQLKSILQNCEIELESISLGLDGRPNGGVSSGNNNYNYTTRLRSRINELWALLGNVKAKREATMANDGNANQLEWAVVDESALEDVAKVNEYRTCF
jgi:nuclear pore complex protein Nup54